MISEVAWRIVEWSRELGRGTVANEKFPGVRFDAACADVDDFQRGEIVRVEVVRSGGTLKITRVSPEDPRFKTTTIDRAAPALDDKLRQAADAVLASRREWKDWRIGSLDERALVLEADDAQFANGAQQELVVGYPIYVDLPVRFGAKIMRLASDMERAYVHAHRYELTRQSLLLTVASDEEHFHFVVGNEITLRNPRG